jgi:hypothetical protein
MLRPLRNWIWAAVVVVIALNIYFVRELFAAELLFGLLIGSLLLVGFVFYLVQQAGELGLAWARPAVRVLAQTARRGWSQLEEISRKPFRHPRSESAQ